MMKDMVIRSWREEQTISERRRMKRGMAPIVISVAALTAFWAMTKDCGLKSAVVGVHVLILGWLFTQVCIKLNWIANTKRLSPLAGFLLGVTVAFFGIAVISITMFLVLHIVGIFV